MGESGGALGEICEALYIEKTSNQPPKRTLLFNKYVGACILPLYSLSMHVYSLLPGLDDYDDTPPIWWLKAGAVLSESVSCINPACVMLRTGYARTDK